MWTRPYLDPHLVSVAQRHEPYTFVVYLYLCARADKETRIAFPGQQRMSKETGISVRKIRQSIRTLEEHGLLKTQKTLRTNRYTVQYKRRPNYHWREIMEPLGPLTFTVYAYLASHVDEEDDCVLASYSLVAEGTGISERQVKREIQRLTALGIITPTRTSRGNQYRLKKEFDETTIGTSIGPGVPHQSDTGADRLGQACRSEQAPQSPPCGTGVPESGPGVPTKYLTSLTKPIKGQGNGNEDDHDSTATGRPPATSPCQPALAMGMEPKFVTMVVGPEEQTARCPECGATTGRGLGACGGCGAYLCWENEFGDPVGNTLSPFSKLSLAALTATIAACENPHTFPSSKIRDRWRLIEETYDEAWIRECIDAARREGWSFKKLMAHIENAVALTRWRRDQENPKRVNVDELLY